MAKGLYGYVIDAGILDLEVSRSFIFGRIETAHQRRDILTR